MPVRPNNQVVEHRDADHVPGLLQPHREGAILTAGRGIAGRVVMRTDITRGIHEDERFVDLSWVNNRQRQ